MNQADTLELLRKMRMDLTQLQARLTSVIESVASMPVTTERRAGYVCPVPTCELPWTTERRLAEHLRVVHDIEAAT